VIKGFGNATCLGLGRIEQLPADCHGKNNRYIEALAKPLAVPA